MVHSHDNQSISQSILEEETTSHHNKSELVEERFNILGSKNDFDGLKEQSSPWVKDEKDFISKLGSKSDCNESIAESKSVSDKGSKSFTIVNSGDASRYNLKSIQYKLFK